MADFPNNILSSILSKVSLNDTFDHALVCRRWLSVVSQIQKSVRVKQNRELRGSTLLRPLSHLSGVTSVSLDYGAVSFIDETFFAEFAAFCPRISQLMLGGTHYLTPSVKKLECPSCLTGSFLMQ
ncbi:hypothetical protein CLOP_g18524 [Closterium sp. NIES-67]|nr:hypothetical protein CLOP_g18524 [Closterium sp. NIES-67]